jgi:hypothetical protein
MVYSQLRRIPMRLAWLRRVEARGDNLSANGKLAGRGGRISCHTLVTAEGPFRRPLKVRVERKHDLASIMGELYRRCCDRM